MCLYTTLDKPLIAEEDIICFKIYERINNELYSPYMMEIAPKLDVITSTNLGTPIKLIHKYKVEVGFHSIETIEGASKIKHRIISMQSYCPDYIILKCIIPRGAIYYKGTFMGFTSYCSNQIKLIEICV